MLALRTINYQQMSNNDAINTQNCKEYKKISDKKKGRKNRDSTKSHDTCPKDGKGYNILQNTQHKLVRTNTSTVPNPSTRSGTSQIAETERSHHERDSTGKRQIHKSLFPEEKELKQTQVQDDQVPQSSNRLYYFIYLVS